MDFQVHLNLSIHMKARELECNHLSSHLLTVCQYANLHFLTHKLDIVMPVLHSEHRSLI